jgi:hypothetical protein
MLNLAEEEPSKGKPFFFPYKSNVWEPSLLRVWWGGCKVEKIEPTNC